MYPWVEVFLGDGHEETLRWVTYLSSGRFKCPQGWPDLSVLSQFKKGQGKRVVVYLELALFPEANV